MIYINSVILYHSHLILFYSQFSTLQSSIFYKTEAWDEDRNWIQNPLSTSQSSQVLIVTHHKYQMIRFDFARHCYSYRQLLNAWKLWFQRAKFDIAMKSSTSQERPPAQIHISCHFCGKSISASMQGLSRTRVPFGRLGSTPNKLKVDFYSSAGISYNLYIYLKFFL